MVFSKFYSYKHTRCNKEEWHSTFGQHYCKKQIRCPIRLYEYICMDCNNNYCKEEFKKIQASR